MNREDQLQHFARLAVEYANRAKTATGNEEKERFQAMRSVVLMDAEGVLARSPAALRAKAIMLWDEDWIQHPTSSDASFLRSLLRDLLQWDS